MRRIVTLFILSIIIFLSSECRPDEGIVYFIPVKGTIDLGLKGFIERAFSRAKQENAKAVILEIDTFGGRVDAATQIRDIIFESGIKSIAFVNKRAISAGALISLAADEIVMAPGGTIGAATPVNISPAGGTSPTSEKEVSYVRKEFKATAERSGHPTDIAEAMVDADVEIKGMTEKGKLLTLTAEEAVQSGLASHKAYKTEDVIRIYGLEGYELKRSEINWSESFVRLLTNPVISGLLLTLGFLGIFFELQMPGWGISGTIGTICLALFFGGHLFVGLAQWAEITIFAGGAILLLIEILVLPGFGIAGLSGIVLIFLSIFLSLIKMPAPGIPVFRLDYLRALSIVAWSMLAVFLTIILAFKFIPHMRIWKKLEPILVLRSREDKKMGYRSSPIGESAYVGKEGVAFTVLRPSGKVKIDDQILDAASDGEYIECGERIKVVKTEGSTFFVTKLT